MFENNKQFDLESKLGLRVYNQEQLHKSHLKDHWETYIIVHLKYNGTTNNSNKN